MKDLSAAHIIAICLAAVVIIGVYGQMRCRIRFIDPLSTKLGVGDLDGWALTHFALFSVLGYMAPGTKLATVAFSMGVAWEICEHWLGKARPAWLGGWGGCDAKEFEKHYANWWFGRWSDLVMNGSGLLVGNMIRQVIR